MNTSFVIPYPNTYCSGPKSLTRLEAFRCLFALRLEDAARSHAAPPLLGHRGQESHGAALANDLRASDWCQEWVGLAVLWNRFHMVSPASPKCCKDAHRFHRWLTLLHLQNHLGIKWSPSLSGPGD